MDSIFSAFINITVRSIVSVLTLFFMAKLIGPRQIAQLIFYDYVLGITIGPIARAVSIEGSLPLWGGCLVHGGLCDDLHVHRLVGK